MKNKAAQQLGRRGGKVTSEAKSAAAVANGAKGGRPHGVIAMLHQADGEWWLSTYKGGSIPSLSFPTAAAARQEAANRGWGVKRTPDCDS